VRGKVALYMRVWRSALIPKEKSVYVLVQWYICR
jgi:hypothetical protein